MKELTKFLEEEMEIKIKNTYKRYQKGLLKYIDDYFSVFQPILNSFSFPRSIDNFKKTPKNSNLSFLNHLVRL
jgi:formiminotetrahydrofolate cyclodeaminase